MTTHCRAEGFVFKKTDSGEADRVFSVFTKDFGKIEVRGRAIRKTISKLRAGIDNFYLSEIEFIQGKNYKTLTDAVVIRKPELTLAKKEFFGKISELLDNLIKGQEKDEKIFNLLNETFEKLKNLETEKLEILYHYFFWNFIAGLGYRPEVQNCAKCRNKLNPYSLYFSNKDGGIICGNCINKKKTENLEPCRKINSDTVKILRLIFKKDWRILSKLKTGLLSQKMLEEISDSYNDHVLSYYNLRNSK